MQEQFNPNANLEEDMGGVTPTTKLESLKKPKSFARRLVEFGAIAGITSLTFGLTGCDPKPREPELIPIPIPRNETEQVQALTVEQIVNQAINPNNPA